MARSLALRRCVSVKALGRGGDRGFGKEACRDFTVDASAHSSPRAETSALRVRAPVLKPAEARFTSPASVPAGGCQRELAFSSLIGVSDDFGTAARAALN